MEHQPTGGSQNPATQSKAQNKKKSKRNKGNKPGDSGQNPSQNHQNQESSGNLKAQGSGAHRNNKSNKGGKNDNRGGKKGGNRGVGSSRGRGKPRNFKYQFKQSGNAKGSKNDAKAAPSQPSLLLTNEDLKAPIMEEITMMNSAGEVSNLAGDGKNHSLYIKNINPKIKVNQLKELLYNFFVPYGRVLDIVVYRTPIKMRGQAFVVLDSILSATRALHELNGSTFIDRQVHIEFAKTKSLVIAEIDGTYSELKRQQLSKKSDKSLKRKYRGELEEELLRLKRRKIETPSNYLIIENLPEQVGSSEGRDKFIMLLRDRDGYRDVNVKGSDVAIVQFTTKEYARNAKLALDGYTFLDKALNVSFYSRDQR